MTTRRPSVTNQSDDRSILRHDIEFKRFLGERLADEQREVDRLQHEIDSHLEQANAKQREQAERMTVVEACQAGIAINDKSTRPAPQLSEVVQRDAEAQAPNGEQSS